MYGPYKKSIVRNAFRLYGPYIRVNFLTRTYGP